MSISNSNYRDCLLNKINFYYGLMQLCFWLGIILFLFIWFYLFIGIFGILLIFLSYICHIKHNKWSSEYSRKFRVKELHKILNDKLKHDLK